MAEKSLHINEEIKHHDTNIIPVKADLAKTAWINSEQYHQMYNESVNKPDQFWANAAKRIDWIRPFTKVKNTSYGKDLSIKWYEYGQLNVCSNCVDRHLADKGDKIAIIWEGDNPKESKKITYKELHSQVGKMANVIKSQGIKKGDRVIIYLPMIPEAAYAMLACARIGAVHSVVFGGFSPESLKGRIEDCGASLVITADEGLRGGKKIALKANVDKAIEIGADIAKVLVVKRTGSKINWYENRDVWYYDLAEKASENCPAEIMGAEDPLFILYTSGSTGKPKGVLHTSAGYLVFTAMTHQYTFDYHDKDIYWCTADIGWVTGHSYIIYGPLANGATTLMFEGVPNYPSWSRCWEIIDKYQVNIFYTAPTAIRSMMREGNDPVLKTSRKSLRILGSVGEPINPEAWNWYYNVVGNKNCPVVDTWWQTETGGILITPLPGAINLKPGSATLPFFGIKPVIVDNDGKILSGEAEGNLCITDSWPGQMRTIYGNHEHFYNTYFSQFHGKYFTGDGARRDKDGYYWITGRIDDVLNVSGHRLGTAEIESSLVGHKDVAEAAVVGYPHDIKGQGIYCFVILNSGIEQSEKLRSELVDWVRKDIGPIAKPDLIHFTNGLPKTRSGKIMRRILRKIAENNFSNFGDINTLLDPAIVEELIQNRLNK